MKKSILAALVAAILALVAAILALVAAAGALAEAAPTMHAATYLNQGGGATVSLEYSDPEGRTWIEVYLLKAGEAEPNMGTLECDGNTYSVVGIQTINPDDPNMYAVGADGRTVLNTDLYFGDCPPPAEGEELFLTVGLTDDSGEEALGELIPITIPAEGESFTSAGAEADAGA